MIRAEDVVWYGQALGRQASAVSARLADSVKIGAQGGDQARRGGAGLAVNISLRRPARLLQPPTAPLLVESSLKLISAATNPAGPSSTSVRLLCTPHLVDRAPYGP